MLNLEEILKEWAKDAVIDEMALDEASRQTTRLHAKYLELHSVTRLRLKKRELEQKILLRDKWLYFNGKMDKGEMDLRKWPYDPFNGLKVMKQDMEDYFNADPDLQRSEESIMVLKAMVDALSEILENIKWRHQTIKNMIDWRRFTSGG
jgi:hypothetical protein